MCRALKSFSDLLQACRRSKFLDFSLDDKVVRGLNLTQVGEMLRGNLRKELNPAYGSYTVPVFYGNPSMTVVENFNFVHQKHCASLPVGVVFEQKRTNNKDCRLPLGEHFSMELAEDPELHTMYLIPRQIANQFMYQLQRQRKIWWMRFSVNPGRYFISDTRRNEDTQQNNVAICARFFNRTEHQTEVELEHLELETGELNADIAGTVYAQDVTQAEQGMSLSVVRVRHDLERATLVMLMDALESASPESCVKIHRKVAPFKCGITYADAASCSQQDLSDLLKHLAYELRAAQLSVFDCSHDGCFQEQLAFLDSIGVPYTLVLRAETLETGLLWLRSRDTTLCETIHVSDLPHYLTKIINA